MTKKQLTIIGATGFLSTTITERLVSSGVQVRVVARNVESAKRRLPEGVEVVYGDVSDEQSLVTALAGTQTLYIHLNTETTDMNLPFYTEREGVANIVAAAKANKVKHIMQISGLESLHEDFFENGFIETRSIRDAGMRYIEQSGIPYTFFYCSFFADSFTRFVENDALYLFGELNHKIHFTNSIQMADHIAQAIDNPIAYNQKYPVQGKDAMTFLEATEKFFAVYDSEVSIHSVPLETINELGLAPEEAGFLTRIWEVCSGLNELFVSERTYEVLGNPEMGMNDIAQLLCSKRNH